MPMAPILLLSVGLVLVHLLHNFRPKSCRLRRTPDAGEAADASGGDAVDATDADEGFFHQADEINWTEAAPRHGGLAGVAEAAEIEDGVADELAGAVIGDVAATVDLVEGYAAAGKELVGGEDVGAAGVTAEGENGRMLEQEQDVFDAALEAEVNELRLQPEACVIRHAAEIEVLDHDCL